ncbi:MAG: flagellar biosynthesis protein FlhA [Gammaproteobacteria bacterium]|nr:flagellar biosynthesis protein FlhA [Gammaproteobacteria bacterium]
MATLAGQTTGLDITGNLQRAGIGVPLLLLAMLAMMVIPLPPFLLDILFTFNISLALIVLMAGIYARRPLDFAVFPTLLLVTTLLRLTLNVASTRVVLLNGHSGPGAAGHVIEAFGDFVVGGNYAVGLVVFAILVIINFVVVTKGAGRISEVSARFTLDAMPGKQMAIDADLNAGIITQEEAKVRRREVAGEADFYGAMDGASKFVRGDAIAGIMILFINILGGLVIGTAQHDMALSEAMRVFTLLTIGDGLVAQIPSLLLATASALMVTRTSTEHDVGDQVMEQLFDNPRTLAVTGGVLLIMGVIPGMPNVAFLTMAAAALGGAWWRHEQGKQRAAAEAAAPPPPPPPQEVAELSWEDVQPTDAIGLEVGYRLIPLVDRGQNGQLLGRLRGVRKKLSQELGFLVPAVHIRDNLDLEPNTYQLTLHGAVVGRSEIHPDKELAINPGQVYGPLKGTVTRDPVFDLEAVWIGEDQREQAQSLGYTVVDGSTVIATHLSQVVQDHAQALLGHEEAQKLLDGLKKTNPRLVEDLVPKVLPLAVVVKVLQNLLAEQIPVRDIRSVLEVLAEHAARTQDPATLTAFARVALGRLIVQQINGPQGELPVITLDLSLERILQQSLETMSNNAMALEPNLANRLITSLGEVHQQREAANQPSVLLVADNLRDFLARFLRPSVKGLHVLGFNEVPNDAQIRIVATVGDPALRAQ